MVEETKALAREDLLSVEGRNTRLTGEVTHCKTKLADQKKRLEDLGEEVAAEKERVARMEKKARHAAARVVELEGEVREMGGGGGYFN